MHACRESERKSERDLPEEIFLIIFLARGSGLAES